MHRPEKRIQRMLSFSFGARRQSHICNLFGNEYAVGNGFKILFEVLGSRDAKNTGNVSLWP
jgi:hypothetical protein